MAPPSRARGPPERGDPREELDQRRFRAIAEPLDVRWIASEPYPQLEVRNPTRRTSYLALWPAYPDRSPAFCTCSDFARRGLGDCKHLEAAWRWLAHPTKEPPGGADRPADIAALWDEVERRIAEGPAAAERGIRELSDVGRVLWERRRPIG
jgi:hypothetical protein